MPLAIDRNRVRGLVKRAGGDADGNDATYEQSMAQLCDAIIRDRAPLLQRYEVGFQLLDKDEDNNKAIGVKIFKVGKFWLFVPCFLLNGKVKGTELLYIKNQNVFVPLQEDWVRYVLGKQDPEIGRPVGRDLARLGVVSPDLRQITRPPLKWAADMSADAGDEGVRVLREAVLPIWAADITGGAFAKRSCSLPEFIREAGPVAVAGLHAIAAHCPRIMADALAFHGDELMKAAFDAAELAGRVPDAPDPLLGPDDDGADEVVPGNADPLGIEPPAQEMKMGSLRVYTYDNATLDGGFLDDLTDEEREGLRQGPLIKDERTGEQVSVPYREDAHQAFMTPTETGIYDVLVRPLAYEKCLVILHPRSDRGHENLATVVRLSDRAFANVHPSKVWVGAYHEDEYAKFFADLPDAGDGAPGGSVVATPSSSDDADTRKYDIFLCPRGEATAPMRAVGVLGVTDGGKSYRVHFDHSRGDNGQDFDLSTFMLDAQPADPPNYRGATVSVGTGRGSKLWTAEGTMYIPAGAKRLRVHALKYDEALLQLASPMHVTTGIVRKLPAVKVAAASGGAFFVNDRRLRRDDALISLVADVGLREATARAILKEATATGSVSFRVKKADPQMYQGGPNAPGFPEPFTTAEPLLYGGSVTGLPLQAMRLPVTDMLPAPDARTAYDPRVPTPDMLRRVQDAAQSGEREVFDTSMIGSIIEATQPDIQVDQHLGKIMAGNDAIARILLSCYWHNDAFAERYGKNDVANLEDMLRNAFQDNGKLVLHLKQKGVEDPLDTQRSLEINTSDD